MNLLEDLQDELGLTYLFIAHDLSVVRHISDRVAVMYLGKIVELRRPRSCTTARSIPTREALLSAVPMPDPDVERDATIVLPGDVPSPINPPSRLSLPPALPLCDGHLHQHGAAVGEARRTPPGRLPPSAQPGWIAGAVRRGDEDDGSEADEHPKACPASTSDG